MYPLVIHLFSISSVVSLLFLPFYALLFLIDPNIFLEEEVSSEDLENWEIFQKPRPGIPAFIAQLYSVGRLLLFDPAPLQGETEWGLNMGVFLYLIAVIILILTMNAALEFILLPWLVVSLIVLPIMVIIEAAKGDFSFEQVNVDYAVFEEYEDFDFPVYEEGVTPAQPNEDVPTQDSTEDTADAADDTTDASDAVPTQG
mmetsp:Transcript_8735/g.13522  ORF Transcript_8735/g.13522 Transcript_8735/m.13522 type:complete len:200 (-) Transcript_8735:81-680(-)